MNTLNKISILLSALVLSACTMSPKNNNVEHNKKFPDPKQSYLKKAQHYDVAQINKLSLGLNKDQVRFLLGNPHFSTGLFNVKTWQYLVALHPTNNPEFQVCQLRVDFNKQNLVESLMWNDQKCENILNQVTPLNTTDMIKINHDRTVKALNFDQILFNFNRSSIHEVVGGASVVNIVMNDIQNNFKKVNQISVIGFADRIGNSQSNIRLSQARARTIANALIHKGIAAENVYVEGKGSTNSYVQCTGIKSKLIQCLEPNRRVVLKVIGE